MVSLDIWSDIACPWCFVGKRRLAAVLRDRGIEADITWHAFELQPDMPPAGQPAREFYGRKFGEQRLAQMWEQMTKLAAQDGITMAFDKQQRAPNTRMAHQAIRIARELGGAALQDKVVDACFEAHFTNGVDISDRDALLAALAPTGIDIETLRTRLSGNDALDDVITDEKLANEIGISGVPFFIANGKLAMSGAQPPDVFASFLAKAAELETQPAG